MVRAFFVHSAGLRSAVFGASGGIKSYRSGCRVVLYRVSLTTIELHPVATRVAATQFFC